MPNMHGRDYLQNLDEYQVEDPRSGYTKTALIVDDDAVNRMILEGMLRDGGYDVVTAEDGQRAIEKYIDHEPDVVLMDIVMPVMDGYQATMYIKRIAGDRFVPIIFLTAVTAEDELAKCVKVGGDDFLTKPYSRVILMAKVEALTRMSRLYSTVKTQRDAIDVHHAQMLREQKVAKKIFSRVVHEGCLDIPIIKYLLSPLSVFNGDLLLAARTPSGGLNVLLGDATGHGLPAAIGAVPLSDLFYELTDTGAAVDEIVLAINSKLKNILPPEFFVCACVLNLSSDFRLLTMWHGGLPEVLIYSARQKALSHRVRSTNFPLGVVDNKRLNTDLRVFDLEAGDRIYLYSDGITEARNDDNVEFGQQNLMSCFEQNIPANSLFDTILNKVKEFRGDQEQSDDLTLLEINADASLVGKLQKSDSGTESLPYPPNWGISMTLSHEDFQNSNPVSILTRFATQVDELMAHRENIFVLLSELYNNALDHGVLELDSAMKAEPDGFLRYLQLRQERLNNLKDGEITITLENRLENGTGQLFIYVNDSGHGFNHHGGIINIKDNSGFSGRGLSLVRSLAKEFQFTGNGNQAIAIYEWRSAEQ